MAKEKVQKSTIVSAAVDALKNPKKALDKTVKAVGDLIASASPDSEETPATAKATSGGTRAKKSTAKKTSKKSVGAKKTPAKKTPAKKSVAKKSTAKKSSAKKKR